MFYGTIHNAGKMMHLTRTWEQKKDSGNIMTKNYDPLSAEKSQMNFFLEKLEQDRENSKYTAIYNKIMNGEELTASEEEELRAHNPQAYNEYKADQAERKAYEEKLRNCNTKEEAERVHNNKILSNFSTMQSIMNNPNIGKAAKLAQAQRILGDTLAAAKIMAKFKASAEYADLPTEEEVQEAQKAEREAQEVQNTGSETVVKPEADSEAGSGDKFETADKPDTGTKPEAGVETVVKADHAEYARKQERVKKPKRKAPDISAADMKVIIRMRESISIELGIGRTVLDTKA